MAVKLTDALREEYGKLFGKMVIREEHTDEIAAIYRRLQTGQRMDDYAFVEEKIGVPWFVVAIIHNLEASLRTDTHLHNGDPLAARTTHAPSGRPADGRPPFSWRDSALDALRLKKLDKVKTWDLETIAFSLETYNGFGYRNNFPHVKSPYLWSFSNIYTSGKYIATMCFPSRQRATSAAGSCCFAT
jgi:lysozyme family protein